MTRQGDYTAETVEVVFNRDIVIHESTVISDIKNSEGLISKRTLVSNHPYVTDVNKELAQMESEAAADQDKFMKGMDDMGPIVNTGDAGGADAE